MDTLENPYTFALPEIESRPLGWFMKPKDANVDWFNDIYTALYIRQEYQDLLAVILEWLFREGVESHPETNELQADHPVSALLMKVEETEEMHAVMDSPVSAEYPKEGIKVEEIEPDSVPLSWTDLRDIQTPPITATSPPSNPFSEEINRGPKLRRLIVAGLPGIGKSAFARYILILRVIANLPTAIVYNSTFLHLYISGKRFEYPIHPDRVRKFPANTWVLVDSGTRLIGVPEELWVAAGVIIQFMSPREGRAQWMKKVFPRPVVVAMQPWSEIELIAARSVQGPAPVPTNIQLHEFVEQYGGSARDAYVYAGQSRRYSEELGLALQNITSANVRNMLVMNSVPNFVESKISHHIFSIYPHVQEGIRSIALSSPTPHVRDRLVAYISELQTQERNDIWRILLHHPYGKTLAGNMLDANFHRVLLNEPVWPLIVMDRRPIHRESQSNFYVRGKSLTNHGNLGPWAGMSSPPPAPAAWLSLRDNPGIQTIGPPQPGQTQLRIDNFDGPAPSTLIPGTYYFPKSRTYASFDSFLLTAPKTAIVLQVTVGKRHGNVLSGFENLKALGIDAISYVIVAQDSSEIEIDFPRALDNDKSKYPTIEAYYILTVTSLWYVNPICLACVAERLL
ncbi:hypothetical protein C8J57DRAFT_1267186 [Mycena rebaudengoi]|nr:hypothetical protein C8J57DRAFT_1267186 [Mycena rebaudengoi]